MNWPYFILGIVAYQIIKMLVKVINREIIDHRAKRFVKLVKVTFKDFEDVTYISADSSDRKAMRELERQLRNDYNIPEKLPENSRKKHAL